jgi:hypothetical protein
MVSDAKPTKRRKNMSHTTRTPFTDKFFQVARRITYFTLGNGQVNFLEHCRELALGGGDCYRLIDAVGFNGKGDWSIGMFDEPVIVCGQEFPKQTVAVFQCRAQGYRFAMFSVDEMDGHCVNNRTKLSK